jgi:hypothetical protein
VPLDPLQDLIVRTASTLPEAHTIALAGGGAMIAHGFVDRATQDVDLFTEIDDTEARHVCAAIAVDPVDGSECIVEVFADGGRLQPRVMLDVGPVLHPDDLAADKVLALWGRARPRGAGQHLPPCAATPRFGATHADGDLDHAGTRPKTNSPTHLTKPWHVRDTAAPVISVARQGRSRRPASARGRAADGVSHHEWHHATAQDTARTAK